MRHWRIKIVWFKHCLYRWMWCGSLTHTNHSRTITNSFHAKRLRGNFDKTAQITISYIAWHDRKCHRSMATDWWFGGGGADHTGPAATTSTDISLNPASLSSPTAPANIHTSSHRKYLYISTIPSFLSKKKRQRKEKNNQKNTTHTLSKNQQNER